MANLGDLKLVDYLGKNSADFLTKLSEARLTDIDKKYLVGDFIRWQSGQGLRHFTYSAEARVAADWGVALTFEPTFQHRNWRDGEDLVEADGLDGFNKRFNALRTDLDNIKDNLVPLFEGLKVLQNRLSTALEEIAVELNAINRQIYDTRVPTTVSPAEPPYKLPDWWKQYATTQPPVVVNPIDPTGPWKIGPKIGDPRIETPKVWFDGTNPDKGLIAGMEASRIDQVAFNGKKMDVWKTDLGLVMTHAVMTLGAQKPRMIVTELDEARDFSRFLTDATPEIQATLPGEFTKKQFEDAFGDRSLGGQSAVRDSLKAIPDDMRFASIEELSDTVAESKAKALAESGQSQTTIIGAVGLNAGVETAEVPIASAKFVDDQTVTLLEGIGVKTVGELAAANPETLHGKLKAAGFTGSVGDVAGMRGIGTALTKLGRL